MSAGLLISLCVVAQPHYSDAQKQRQVMNMASQVSQYHQKRYEQMSPYDKRMYQLAQARVLRNSYDVESEEKLDLSQLTEAEKKSVERTQQNDAYIKKMLEGM